MSWLAGLSELEDELKDDDISTLAPRISLKVDRGVVLYQIILSAKAQG